VLSRSAVICQLHTIDCFSNKIAKAVARIADRAASQQTAKIIASPDVFAILDTKRIGSRLI